MALRRLGSTFDTRISQMTERATRLVSRRNVLRTAFVSGAAGIAAISIGETPADALEHHCARNCGPTPRCSNCPDPQPGCPSGYSLCKGSPTGGCFNNQGYRCEWPAGQWIACTGLGNGNGYKICKDCIGPGGCPDWCTCLNHCVCCHCSTAEDFKKEQQRIQLLTVP
jgi:hypothetical protein